MNTRKKNINVKKKKEKKLRVNCKHLQIKKAHLQMRKAHLLMGKAHLRIMKVRMSRKMIKKMENLKVVLLIISPGKLCSLKPRWIKRLRERGLFL
jgi:hypothetical protein